MKFLPIETAIHSHFSVFARFLARLRHPEKSPETKLIQWYDKTKKELNGNEDLNAEQFFEFTQFLLSLNENSPLIPLLQSDFLKTCRGELQKIARELTPALLEKLAQSNQLPPIYNLLHSVGIKLTPVHALFNAKQTDFYALRHIFQYLDRKDLLNKRSAAFVMNYQPIYTLLSAFEEKPNFKLAIWTIILNHPKPALLFNTLWDLPPRLLTVDNVNKLAATPILELEAEALKRLNSEDLTQSVFNVLVKSKQPVELVIGVQENITSLRHRKLARAMMKDKLTGLDLFHEPVVLQPVCKEEHAKVNKPPSLRK